ncbi:MAG: hypothetical protein ACI8V2_004704 [Candidatus Latescibacterota bacterium]|jgi:hypothetical protein
MNYNDQSNKDVATKLGLNSALKERNCQAKIRGQTPQASL